MQKYKVKEEY